MKRLLILLLFAATPLLAQSQEPINADRPGFADGPDVVGAHIFQLETGLAASDEGATLIALPTLLRFGMTDSFELRVESDIAGHSDGELDAAPIAAGFKWKISDGTLPLSLIASVQPPSGGGALQSDDFEGEARLTSDIDLGGGYGLTPNVGVSFVEGGERAAIFAATVEKELGNALPFVDFEATVNEGDASAIVDGGVAWIVRPDTQLDISAGFDVAGDGYPDWFISAGFSRRF